MLEHMDWLRTAGIVLVLGFCVFITIKFASSASLTAGLIFIDLHEFRKEEYVTFPKIRDTARINDLDKLLSGLEFLISKGMVQCRHGDFCLEYRVHPDHWKEPRVPTKQFN